MPRKISEGDAPERIERLTRQASPDDGKPDAKKDERPADKTRHGRRRAKRRPKKTASIAHRIFYWLSVIAIAAIWGLAFRSYFRHYDSIHPELTWAQPWIQTDYSTARGVLLWEETLIKAPRAGEVSYPMGRGPMRVYRGAVVARVKQGGAAHDVKTPVEGYFIAGLDGHEGNWRYADLWVGPDELPDAGEITMLEGGTQVKAGAAIGKIIPQPQQMRFIGYADAAGDLERKLAADRVRVKMDRLDTSSRVSVGVYENYGHRLKIYLRLPWFPPDALKSRAAEMLIEIGDVSGVTVPDSAVTMRGGTTGVFLINGSTAVFRPVEGRAIDGGRFLVTNGMRLGDAVAADAQKAVEGRINLW